MAAAVSGWWFGFGYFVAGLYWLGFAFLVDAKTFGWLLPFAVTALPVVLHGREKIKAQPRKGLTLIWPVDWTHLHRGIVSPSEESFTAARAASFSGASRSLPPLPLRMRNG